MEGHNGEWDRVQETKERVRGQKLASDQTQKCFPYLSNTTEGLAQRPFTWLMYFLCLVSVGRVRKIKVTVTQPLCESILIFSYLMLFF
jgi:hypothetical protein